MEKKIRMLGIMDNVFELTSRVYDRKNGCPTINTCGGGSREPKVVKKYEVISKTSNK